MPNTSNFNDFVLPNEGTGPNDLAVAMKKAGLLTDTVANAGDGQDIGKRYFRPYLRGAYADVHEKYGRWTLTREIQYDLMTRYGTEAAAEFVKRQRANAKRKASKASKA